MNDYNRMPEDLTEITTYEEWQDFMTYCTESKESRQPQYNPTNILEGSFGICIFWIKKELNLGYLLKNDWKNKKVTFHKIGSAESWNKFKKGFADQFKGDNS